MRNTLFAAAAALAATLALPAAAQTAVNPADPNSASGGVMAQATNTPAAATTPATARQPMNEAQVRDHLRGMGYSNLEGFERRGDMFHVREARRWGERVENLQIDPNLGHVVNARPMDERQIRTMLREIGWSNIRDYRQEGQYVRMKAERNNREHDLRIDPRVGILDQPGEGR